MVGVIDRMKSAQDDRLKLIKFIIPLILTIILSLIGTAWMLGNGLHDKIEKIDDKVNKVEISLKEHRKITVTHHDLSDLKNEVIKWILRSRQGESKK